MKKNADGPPSVLPTDGCTKVLEHIVGDPTAQPEHVQRHMQHAPQQQSHAGHVGHHGGLSSTRTAEHNGHQIEIKTTYEIKIDGKPFEGHVMVNEEGHLHCHSIPYSEYESAVDFVKSLLDIYADNFDGGQIA